MQNVTVLSDRKRSLVSKDLMLNGRSPYSKTAMYHLKVTGGEVRCAYKQRAYSQSELNLASQSVTCAK